MTAFRLYSKLDTFYGNTAQLLANGSLKFYEAGTTTPADVYGGYDGTTLSANNGPTVALDSSGRPNVDVWGDIAFFVEAFDSLGVKQGEADWVQVSGGEATALPAPTLGKFLVGNGVAFALADVREVPDPTGQDNKILGVVGGVVQYVTRPSDGAAGADPDIIVAASSFQAGTSTDETKFLIQTGTGTAPVVAGVSTSVSVTFPTPYATLSHVGITPTVASVSGTGSIPVNAVTGYTPGSAATAVTVNFRNPSDGDIVDSGDFITTPVTFTWIAFGTVEVPA